MSVQTQAKPVSDKQVALLQSLLKERQHEFTVDFTTLTGGYGGSASTLISALFKCPKVGVSKKDEPGDGIYKTHVNGEVRIYKVYKMVHGSGRQGVKGMKVRTDSEGNRYGEFSYIGLAVKHLPADAVKMGKDEAKQYGTLYGFCVRCGKTLTDDKSIAQGMGDWCSKQEW